jgi:hypothetical protein
MHVKEAVAYRSLHRSSNTQLQRTSTKRRAEDDVEDVPQPKQQRVADTPDGAPTEEAPSPPSSDSEGTPEAVLAPETE